MKKVKAKIIVCEGCQIDKDLYTDGKEIYCGGCVRWNDMEWTLENGYKRR